LEKIDKSDHGLKKLNMFIIIIFIGLIMAILVLLLIAF